MRHGARLRRGLTDARGLAIKKLYRRRATRNDFWLAYEGAFPKRTHRLCGKAEGETNHVERWFGTLCQRLGRSARKTFSKCEQMREAALRLFIHHYKEQPIN